MTSIRLDNTNDLGLNTATGNFYMTNFDEDMQQKLNVLLNTNRGELPWNREIGLDHYEMLSNATSKSNIQAILANYLKDMLPNEFKLLQITKFDVDYHNRTTHMACEITLSSGNETNNYTIDDYTIGGDDNSTNS